MTAAYEDPMDARSSSPTLNLDILESDHEEADTRIVLSIMNSTAEQIIVISQDTDVLVILIANYKHFGKKKEYFQRQTGKEKNITDIKE